MADLIGDTISSVGDYIPNIPAWAFLVISIVIAFVILFAVITGIVVYIIIDRKKFNKKAVIFQKVGKTIEPIGNFRAGFIRFGDSGDKIFFVKKIKIYLPSPSIQTGRNIYWFYLREDGEYINFGIDDIDEKMRKMGIAFLDKEMRYGRVSIQKGLEKRFQKVGFWEKYGGLIVWAIFIVICMLGMWFIFDRGIQLMEKSKECMEIGAATMDKSNIVIERLNQMIERLNLGATG